MNKDIYQDWDPDYQTKQEFLEQKLRDAKVPEQSDEDKLKELQAANKEQVRIRGAERKLKKLLDLNQFTSLDVVFDTLDKAAEEFLRFNNASCPVDCDFPCPRSEVNASLLVGCLLLQEPGNYRYLRECWVMHWRKAVEGNGTNR